MQHGTLAALYLVIGMACAGFVWFSAAKRDAQVVTSALVSLVLWPLWAPFALQARETPVRGPLGSRIAGSLDATLLSRSECVALLRKVDAAERRLGELDARLLALRGEDRAPGPLSLDAHARAQLRRVSRCQLEALREREHAALAELLEVCELLGAQQTLSSFGSSAGATDLRDELWVRLQTLSELNWPEDPADRPAPTRPGPPGFGSAGDA
jgi:hypothetical protein